MTGETTVYSRHGVNGATMFIFKNFKILNERVKVKLLFSKETVILKRYKMYTNSHGAKIKFNKLYRIILTMF